MFGKKIGYDVFLGGTTNESTWRDTFIELLRKKNPEIACFNPVVENWNDESIKLENFVKYHAVFHVYVITPRMRGVYSIAEMVESAMGLKNKITVFCILDTDTDADGTVHEWDPVVRNSLNATSNLLRTHGAIKVDDLNALAEYIVKTYTSAPTLRETISASIKNAKQ